jgi:putative transposase
LPKWNLVAKHFYRWKKLGVWQVINDKLWVLVRVSVEKEEQPSTCIIDSQSVKTTEAGGSKGYDAAKKINGRKRHIVVDTLGRVCPT